MDNNFRSGFVAIIGRPNVGKSTLMNHLIGQKIAITSNKPQTTRNKIQTVYTCDEGQIVFLDTPGIHKAKNKLDKKCRAKVCTALRQFHINPEFCIGCGKCAKNCPAGAISGKIKHPHVINNDVCIKCGSCKDNCNFDAIYVEA